MNKIVLAGVISLIAGAASAALPVYSTSFEAADGFAAGPLSSGTGGWTVISTPVDVTSGGAQSGSQYLNLGAGAIVDRAFDQAPGEGGVLWVEGYFRGEGSSRTLAEANYPSSATSPASAIIHFSSANGIEFYDGDGAGASRGIVDSGVDLGPGNATTWYKVTVRLDFSSTPLKLYQVWINDAQKGTNLGFRDNSVTKLTGFRNFAEGGAGLDAFRIILPIKGDANGDSKVDSADVVKLIEYIAAPTSDPILAQDVNVNGTGGVDSSDVAKELDNLIGKP